jgi:hypothetical protein
MMLFVVATDLIRFLIIHYISKTNKCQPFFRLFSMFFSLQSIVFVLTSADQ